MGDRSPDENLKKKNTNPGTTGPLGRAFIVKNFTVKLVRPVRAVRGFRNLPPKI